MSKLIQIENALLAMDGGRFQQLCDAYLRKRGYQGINSLGRVIGTDKVARGTPDTWIPQPNGKFVFAEYTTQKTGIAAKLRDDFTKCVNEAKTGIPIEKIQEIFFCHTSVLTPAEESALLDKAEEHRVLLTPIGIGPLVHDLYGKYPGLALDYLGVEVDTGQVLAPDEFVAVYGMNALATPLDTNFHARESEVVEVLEALKTRSLLVISGRAGVGKSRLVLECFRRFAESHPGWEVRCILNRGRDLFQDLQIYFAPPGKYLVLVDDANRVSGFDYVLQLLHDPKAGREIKVVATVRDYARQKVKEAVQPYGGAADVELHQLTDDEIKAIVRDQYGILNDYFLSRIADIAKGNPRLAVMAAQVVIREQNLGSIADVTTLYDEYYATVRQELDDAFGDRVLLCVAGIISFFRNIDRKHEEQMDVISANFGIAPDAFWEAAQRLHEMELVDMYEDEVVKISDQVLATYLFYLSFFKERNVLDVGIVVERLFPRYRHRFMDGLFGALSAFDNEAIVSKLRPHVQRARQSAHPTGEEDKLLHLIDAFWFVSPTDTLVAIQERLECMPIEPRGEELKLDYRGARGSVPEGSVLNALGKFRYGGEWRRPAIDLLLDYAAKRPEDLPHVLHFLVERYGFRHTSPGERYEVECTVVNALIDRIARDEDSLFVRIFFVVAEAFLHTHFDTTETKNDAQFLIYKFDLTVEPELIEMRSKVWEQLFALARGPHRERALGVIHAYATSRHDVTVPEIVAEDSKHVIAFIDSMMDPDVFGHCVLVQDYLDLLNVRGVPHDESLRTRFRSETYVLSQLLNPSWSERAEIGFDRYHGRQQERLREHFIGYDFLDYLRLFEQCTVLLETARDDSAVHQIRGGVEGVLLELAERDPELFAKVLDRYLAAGNPLGLWRTAIPTTLITHRGPAWAFSILTAHEFQHKRRWLFDFYEALSAEDIDNARLEELYTLYRQGEAGEFPYNLSFLGRYASVDPGVLSRVVEILVKKAEEFPSASQSFESLFSSHNDRLRELPPLFSGRGELLERAYLVMQQQQQHADYDGAAFDMLLSLDTGFGRRYIEWVFEHHTTLHPHREAPDPHDDHRHYDFIWRRTDHADVMEGITQRVYELEKDRIAYRSYLSVFYAVREPDPEQEQGSAEESVRKRQDRFLTDLIARRAADVDFVEWLFGTVCSLSPERRYRLLQAFLTNNRIYDDFRRLPLEYKMYSASGSFVPVFQKRVEVLESFLPLFKSADLLRHRKLVEDEIGNYRTRIEEEKKRDFMRD